MPETTTTTTDYAAYTTSTADRLAEESDAYWEMLPSWGWAVRNANRRPSDSDIRTRSTARELDAVALTLVAALKAAK